MRKVVEFGDDWVEVTDDHPLLRLFSRANPYLNGFDATVLRIIHGELTGNAYLHPVIDRALGVPTELWLMPPQWVTIVPDKELFIKGYKYGASEATQVDLKPDEVIHFKRPHPNDMYYGMGKVEGAWGSVQANNALHEMDHAMFKNRARPDYIGTVKGSPSDEELDRLEVAIKESLRGTDKVGKFILTSADLTLQPMSFPPKDLTGRDEIVEEIAAIFGVPVSMLKTNDPNLASATTGFAQWREGTIAPLLRMDEETLNQRLLPLFGIEGEAVLAYDDPVRSNEQFELTSRSASVAGGWRTPNEARTEEGLEPLDTPYANELKGAAAAQGQPMPSVGGGVAPAPPAVVPTASTALPAEPTIAPAAAALNGAQISSLVELAVSASDGTLSLATARAIASAAFPDIAPSTIASIFDGVAVKSPAQVAEDASKKNCGVGSEGFEAGNDCGAGGGSGGGSSKPTGSDKPAAAKPSTRKPSDRRVDAGAKPHPNLDAPKRHAVPLPKNPRSMNIDTMDQALSALGYKRPPFMERIPYSEGIQLTDSSGNSATITGTQALALVYGNSTNKVTREINPPPPRKSLDLCDPCCGSFSAVTKGTKFGDAIDADALKDFVASANGALREQVAVVLAEIQRNPTPTPEVLEKISAVLAQAKWDTKLTDALAPYISRSIGHGITAAQTMIQDRAGVNITGTGKPSAVALAAYAKDEAERLANRVAADINANLSDSIRLVLGTGIAEGLTSQELAERVQGWADDEGDEERGTMARALTIARTESARASNLAESDAWAVSGLVAGKRWLLQDDACEFCVAAAAEFETQSVGLDEPFYALGSTLVGTKGGEMTFDYGAVFAPPLHPNCRCTIEPVMVDRYQDIAEELDAANEAQTIQTQQDLIAADLEAARAARTP
jgi:HK97 family phage portal protein